LASTVLFRRRAYGKLARRKRGTSSPRRLTVFVRYENVVKLLKFLK
jgi:hypothetical protein